MAAAVTLPETVTSEVVPPTATEEALAEGEFYHPTLASVISAAVNTALPNLALVIKSTLAVKPNNAVLVAALSTFTAVKLG